MKRINTTKRSREPEVMDDFELQGVELAKTLQDIDKINKWLGGNKVTLRGIKELLKNSEQKDGTSIVDVGCGNGAMLREIAKWGRANNHQFQLIGIDANPHAIKIAENLSVSYPEIKYSTQNIFSESYKEQKFDIVLCTLTLHHFQDKEITSILNIFYRQAHLGIVINDLHRSREAYYLFQGFCRLFIRNEIARKDGLISILRGFKKKDLEIFALDVPARHQEISWRWAFRYRWIIKKGDSKI